MKKLILSVFLAFALCGFAQAQKTPTVATVDISAVMARYNKATDLRNALENDAKQAKASQEAAIQKLQALRAEAEQLINESKNQILNEQGRKEAQAKAQAKAQEFQEKDREAYQQNQNAISILQQRQELNLKQLVEDLRPVVETISREKNIDLVLNSTFGAGGILYSDKSLDITDEVINRLNAAYKRP